VVGTLVKAFKYFLLNFSRTRQRPVLLEAAALLAALTHPNHLYTQMTSKMQRSAGIQIVKYKAKVLRHSFPMSNTNNAVVGATPLWK